MLGETYKELWIVLQQDYNNNKEASDNRSYHRRPRFLLPISQPHCTFIYSFEKEKLPKDKSSKSALTAVVSHQFKEKHCNRVCCFDDVQCSAILSSESNSGFKTLIFQKRSTYTKEESSLVHRGAKRDKT